MSAARDSRAFSAEGLQGLAILGLVMLLLGAIAATPWLWVGPLEAQNAERALEVRLIESRIARAARQQPQQLTEADGIARMFLQGETNGLTLANFQALLNATAQANGLTIARIEPLQTDVQGPLSTYRMELAGQGSIESVRNFALALEAMVPVVFIREVQLAPDNAKAAEGDPFLSEKLMVGLKVEAFGWKEAVAP